MTPILEHFWTSLDQLDHRSPKTPPLGSEAGALQRVRPLSSTAGAYAPLSTTAGRSLALRPPDTGWASQLRTCPQSLNRHLRHNTAHHHQQHAKTRESIRARERASGAGGLAGAWRCETAVRRHRHQRPPAQRQRPSCAARWCVQFLSRSFRASTSGEPPANSAARPRPRMPPLFGKYLSAREVVASATRPVNQRIWEAGKSGLVSLRGADA
ncbi:hypothetical protein SAMN05216330_102434 [Bradyrhizobium sp. Ghvi]|nr:hypothetical protein SAMN05216330_102434 [Bradyrhizobium sp. Ghvi]